MIRRVSLSFAVLIACLALTCAPMPSYLKEKGCSDLNKKYIFGVDASERVEVFEALEMPLQYDVFVCAMESVHPPDLSLLNPLAKRGKDVVPFLSHELQIEEHDWTVYNLIRVFARMDVLGTYRVRDDQNLVELLQTKAQSIADPLYRTRASELLEGLEQ